MLGNNMFGYCNNNPVNFADPFGYTPSVWFWNIGQWIDRKIEEWKEKIEEHKEAQEKRKKSVSYTPNKSGKGAKIENANNITSIFAMYEFISENRGEELGGSNSGVVVEWVCHNIAYEYAAQKGDKRTMDQAATVDIGYTIWSDNHGTKTAIMLGIYSIWDPYSFVKDLYVHMEGN